MDKPRTYSVLNKTSKSKPLISKKEFSICEKCKCQFRQEWDGDVGKFTEWKLCPKCREEAKAETVKTISTGYSPFDYQTIMHNSNARFRVVSGGIRSGKDHSMTFEIFKYACACANESVSRRTDELWPVRAWIVAPNNYIAEQDLEKLKKLIPAALVQDYSKTTKSILTKNGILFEIKSAYDPESLVAVALDAVLITEAARISDLETVWSNLEGRLNSPGRGLGGEGGIGLINSSPLGKNYFYKMWCWGQKGSPDYDPQWESWTWSHWDNPKIQVIKDKIQSNGRTYKENLERRMSTTRYRQDYLAEFLSDEFAVFPNFEEKCLEKIGNSLSSAEREDYIKQWKTPLSQCTYKIGYDPASIGDDPAVVIIENETGRLKEAISLYGLDWDAQFDRIKMLSRKYFNAVVFFSKTGHEFVGSQLTKRGVLNQPLNEQGSNKATFVENLARIVENGQLRVLDDGSEIIEKVKFEFNDYVREKRGSTNIVYHNGTNSGHDDFVSATYMAFSDVESTENPIVYDFVLEALVYED